jgi:hypothetical protein
LVTIGKRDYAVVFANKIAERLLIFDMLCPGLMNLRW